MRVGVSSFFFRYQMRFSVLRDTAAVCCVYCRRSIGNSVVGFNKHFVKGQQVYRYSSNGQLVGNDASSSGADSELEVRKLLKDSQISMQTPLDNEHVNLDENSGDFQTKLNAKTVMYLHQPKKEIPESRFELETKSAYMFAGDSANLDSVFVERLTREPRVKEVFEEATSIVGYDVLDLCLNGSPSLMHDVQYSDVVTFTRSMGELAWIKRHRPLVHSGVIMTAGIGVGEISSLVAAGAITLSQALKLVKDRSEALQQATNLSEGGLALVYGSKKTSFPDLCNQLASFGELGGIDTPVCSVAMHLHSCTKVIGGHMQCLKHLKGLQKDFNIRKFSILDAPAAFHTSLMKPAEEPFAVSLKDIIFNDPKTWSSSVYSCVTGMRYKRDDFAMKNSYKAKLLLLKQLTSPVKWETVANRLAQRGRNNEYPNYYEVGSGSFIRSSFKQINNRAASRCKNLKSFIEVVERREFEA